MMSVDDLLGMGAAWQVMVVLLAVGLVIAVVAVIRRTGRRIT
jgi:hypothetical protein